MDNYRLDEEFPEGHEVLSGSEVPINAFVIWNSLRYFNHITCETDDVLGEKRSSVAGVEINLPFDTHFSLFLVHGINSAGNLVCWMFVNRDMAETFKEKELTDGMIWEVKDINLEDMREAGGLPELVG